MHRFTFFGLLVSFLNIVINSLAHGHYVIVEFVKFQGVTTSILSCLYHSPNWFVFTEVIKKSAQIEPTVSFLIDTTVIYSCLSWKICNLEIVMEGWRRRRRRKKQVGLGREGGKVGRDCVTHFGILSLISVCLTLLVLQM